jgi:hypothetical protein
MTYLQFESVRNVSCCPSILISIAGSHIQIAGAILTDIFIIQPFTDFIFMGGDPYLKQQIIKLTKIDRVSTDLLTHIFDSHEVYDLFEMCL